MEEKNFIAYEYQTKTVKAQNQTKVIDMCEAFGWEVTDITPGLTNNVVISFKRNRKQRHKQELSKLERQAESTFKAIDNLENSKTTSASIFSLIFGIISALIFGGGMCLTMLIDGSVIAIVGGVILGIIGIVLCSVNYVIYKKMVENKTKQVLPTIDDNEEKLANILEKGNELLSADEI